MWIVSVSDPNTMNTIATCTDCMRCFSTLIESINKCRDFSVAPVVIK